MKNSRSITATFRSRTLKTVALAAAASACAGLAGPANAAEAGQDIVANRPVAGEASSPYATCLANYAESVSYTHATPAKNDVV